MQKIMKLGKVVGVRMRPIIEVVLMVLQAYTYILLAYVGVSWARALGILNSNSRLVFVVSDFLSRLTEPALRVVRRFIPVINGLDFSVLFVLVGIYLLQRYLGMYAGHIVMYTG